MVKLASVRDTRLYGSAGTKDIWEDFNAFGYLIAALLFTAGTVLLLPGYNANGGLWLILVAVVIIALVNLHDLYAQVAGVDFRISLATLDSQFVAIEIAVPLVQAIGSIIYFIGVLLRLLVERGDYNESKSITLKEHANVLLIVAPALWLLGSIHNLFQVYENTELDVQAFQKGVSLPFVIGSLLLLLGSIVNVLYWPSDALHTVQILALSLAVTGAALLLVGGVVNAVKVIHTQHTQRSGGHVEKLRGGAHEALIENREEAGTYAPVNKDDHDTEIESGHGGNPYRKNIVAADR